MKYGPLRRYLQDVGTSTELGFAEIEHIIGSPLPASARKYAAWWSNRAEGHVNAQAWLSAGFKAEGVDLAACRVVFRRAKRVDKHLSNHAVGSLLDRIRDRLGGSVTIAPGVDLTDPLWLHEQDDL